MNDNAHNIQLDLERLKVIVEDLLTDNALESLSVVTDITIDV